MTNQTVSIEADQLRTILTALKPWQGRKSANATVRAHQHMHIAFNGVTLTFTATDFQNRLSATLTGFDRGETPFEGLVMLDSLQKIVGKRKGAVTFSLKDSLIDVTIGKRNATLAANVPVEDFPKLEELETVTKMTVNNWPAVADVLPAASGDESRPILTGVYFAPNGEVATTDFYRLYVTSDTHDPFESPNPSDYRDARDNGHIVHADKLGRFLKLTGNEAEPLAQVTRRNMRLVGQHAKSTEITLSAHICVIEGTFPNYVGLIPKVSESSQQFTVNADLIQSVKEIEPMLRKSGVPIRISPNVSGLMVHANVQDEFKISDDIDTVSTLTDHVAFNGSYLLDALVDGAEIHVRDDLKPMIQLDRFNGCERLRLLMPVRIN